MDEIEQAQSQNESRQHSLGRKVAAVALSAMGIAAGVFGVKTANEGPADTPRIEQPQPTDLAEPPIIIEKKPTPAVEAPVTNTPTATQPETTPSHEVNTGRIEKLKAAQILIYDSSGNLVCNGTKTLINNKPYVLSDGHCVTARDPAKYENMQKPYQDKVTGLDVTSDVKGIFEARRPDKPNVKITGFRGGAISVSQAEDILILEAEPNAEFDAIPAIEIFEGESRIGEEVQLRGQSLVDALENKPVREHAGTYVADVDFGGSAKGRAVALKLDKDDDISIITMGRSGGAAASNNGYYSRFVQYIYLPGEVKNMEEQEENGQEVMDWNRDAFKQVEEIAGKPLREKYNFIMIFAEDKPEDLARVAGAIHS